MSRLSALPVVCGLALVFCFPPDAARAQNDLSFVSSTGNDGNPCTRSQPCGTFRGAHDKTNANGTVVVLDAADYKEVTISKSITIVSGGAPTAINGGCCDIVYDERPLLGLIGTPIVILAGPADVVTLRGLVFSGIAFADTQIGTDGVLIHTAHQVNIENCVFTNASQSGIVVAPSMTLGTAMSVNITDTEASGNGSGIRILSVPGQAVNAAIKRTRTNSNSGGGIRIDGSNGGPITVSISDSSSSFNGGNGVVAISGPGLAEVNVARSVMASNGASGVQSNQLNGGASIVTVRGSTLANNAGGNANFFGGGTLLSYGDNSLVGANGTGFSGPLPMQ